MILERERQTPDGGFNGEIFVEDVIRDLESSDLTTQDGAFFRFVDKVNRNSPEITMRDIEAAHDAGWNDEALYYAITVCALFNFYNRWVDASGVHALSDEAHRGGGKGSAKTSCASESSVDRRAPPLQILVQKLSRLQSLERLAAGDSR